MKLLKGYYAYLAVSGGLLLGLAAQNNWALQMLAFALVSAGALSVQGMCPAGTCAQALPRT